MVSKRKRKGWLGGGTNKKLEEMQPNRLSSLVNIQFIKKPRSRARVASGRREALIKNHWENRGKSGEGKICGKFQQLVQLLPQRDGDKLKSLADCHTRWGGGIPVDITKRVRKSHGRDLRFNLKHGRAKKNVATTGNQ